MPELAEARRHLAQCAGCRAEVNQFQMTHAMLKTSADVEPPRRIMFEFEKPRVASGMWRLLAPMAASAAVALAVVNFAPRPQSQPQIVERIVQQPVTAQPAPAAAPPADYQKILGELNELKKRDAMHAKEIQQVNSALAWLDKYQHVFYRETEQNGADIQMLAKNLTETR